MTTNPYQSNYQEEPPTIRSDGPWRSILYPAILGLGYGIAFGGLAAALVGFTISVLVAQLAIRPGDIGEPITNAIFCSVVGAILGGGSYSVPSFLIGLWASRTSQTFHSWIPIISAATCGGIGAIGGTACGMLVSGTGIDGVPASPAVLLVSSMIGLLVGAAGGLAHGTQVKAFFRR